jgi:hypothetical protein
MNVDPLRDAFGDLLAAAATVSASAETVPPPPGEWDADRIVAHVALIGGITLAAVSAVASGVHTTYDNRIALDTWTIDHLVALCGGGEGLRERVRVQGDALCLVGGVLGEAELGTLVPTRLLSHGELLVDQPLTLADILGGLAGVELPGHTHQLLSLLPPSAR